MIKLISRKEALGMIDSIFTSFHFGLMSLTDSGIDNAWDRDYFWAEANKVDQGRLTKDYEQTVSSLDAVGFKAYYKYIGTFASKYKIGCWEEYNQYEPILIEELNDELGKHKKTEEKLDLIDSFTIDELQSDLFIFDSKVQVLYDILDDFIVGDNKEKGINKVLSSFNSSDKSGFISKIQSDKKLLNSLIDKVNGNEKDEMLALIGEIFISSGFIKDQKAVLLNNKKIDTVSATFEKGKVFIDVRSQVSGGGRDYATTKTQSIPASPFDIIGLNYDGREIRVPALLLLNSWSNSAATPEGIFFNYKDEDIDWKTLDAAKKDEYFYSFVAHYLPSGFIEALGSPIQIIIMACITILTGGLFAELQAAFTAAGIVMTVIDTKNAIDGIITANNQKDAASTMHEAKKAAKIMANSIAKLTVDVINVICTVAGSFNGKKKIQRREDIENFHLLTNEKKEILFESLSNKELYTMVHDNPRYNWITKDYDLITKENIKDIVILRKDGNLNLDWPKYAGLQLESIESICKMNGKVFVSRSGSPEGKTIGYGNTVEAWYASNSKRSIPSSASEIQVGVMDVGKYKKIIKIINSYKKNSTRIKHLQELGLSEDKALILINDYNSWNGKRFEIFGPNGVIDGLNTIQKSIDSTYGFSGKIAPWNIGNLTMEGGSGQLNTVFSWQIMIDTDIISENHIIKIQ